jgi:hypothetical protein
MPMSATAVTLALRMDRISLTVPADPAFRGTLRLVVGGIGTRLRLPYEQVNELQLAVETLVSNRAVVGSSLVVEADVDDAAACVAVGPFAPDADADRLRVLERLVREARVTRRDGQAEWVELVVGGPTEAAT